MAPFGHPGGSGGPQFEGLAVGIGFQKLMAFLRGNAKFVESTSANGRNKAGPDTASIMKSHRVGTRIPVVEIPDNADGNGMRCPDGEPNTFHATASAKMGAQHVVNVPVSALAKEV
jgi:hypothetical protein